MSNTDSEYRANEKKAIYLAAAPTNSTAMQSDTMHLSSQSTATNTISWQFSGSTGGTEQLPFMDIPARRQIEQIGDHIYMMENRLGRVEQRLNDLEIVRPRVVMLREIDEPTAEREIVDYLKAHGEADTAELVENLGIDIDLVLAVVQHLKNEGSVERVANSHESR
jgi:hypothetical protein